jgi:hypothetical protein
MFSLIHYLPILPKRVTTQVFQVVISMAIPTGLMIIKPSVDEFNNIISAYLSTPYDPISGWNYEGHHHCLGKLGLNGFLSYYFANDP